MSDLILQSAGIVKNRAIVNENGQLLASVESISEGSFASNQGRAYATGLPLVAVNTTEGSVLWLNYTGTKTFSIGTFFLGWDGGTVSRNKPMYARFYIGSSVPADNANRQQSGWVNQLLGSNQTLDGNVFLGTTGNYMDVADLGNFAGVAILNQGETLKPFEGIITLTPNTVMSFTFQAAEEDGFASFFITGWEGP